MMRRRSVRVICGMLLVLTAGTMVADPLSSEDEGEAATPLPLWEMGLFNGVAYFPQYRGSDEHSLYAFPFPYFVYRGEVIRSGRDGVKGIFFRAGRLQSSLSFSGSAPVSDDNEAREGMPRCGLMLEAGPALKYRFTEPGAQDTLFLIGSVRAALAMDVDDDFRGTGEGFRGTLSLAYLNRSLFESRDLLFGGRITVDGFDDEYSDYYYSVAADYVTESRPLYEAEGGYAGVTVAAYAMKTLSKSFSAAVFASWTNLDGVAFEESPLVREENTYTVGCALVWRMFKSKRTAGAE